MKKKCQVGIFLTHTVYLTAKCGPVNNIKKHEVNFSQTVFDNYI